MGLIEKSMLERWEIAKIEARLDKAKSIKQQKVCCTSNITDDKAQPVKHGRWLKRMSTPDSLKCSVCGNNHEYETTYCPNCGAIMDLKDGGADNGCKKV